MICSGSGHVFAEGVYASIAEEELATEQFATKASNTAVTELLSPRILYVTLLVFQEGWIIAETRLPPGLSVSFTFKY